MDIAHNHTISNALEQDATLESTHRDIENASPLIDDSDGHLASIIEQSAEMEDTIESFLTACEHLLSDILTTEQPPLTCDTPLPRDPRDHILDTTLFESTPVVPLTSFSVSESSRDPILLRDDVPDGSCSGQP